MTKARRPKRPPSAHHVPRTARLSELLREIIAEELERIDDERLERVSITAIDVDADLNRAIVYFDSMAGPEGDEQILGAFSEKRVRLQKAVGSQMRARKTPILDFRPDEVIRGAERIESLLRDHPLPVRPVVSEDDDR
jgi:ribosome-binding factor A